MSKVLKFILFIPVLAIRFSLALIATLVLLPILLVRLITRNDVESDFDDEIGSSAHIDVIWRWVIK